MRRPGAASVAAAAAVLLVLAATLGPASPTELEDFARCVICGDRGGADAILNFLLFMPVGAALAMRIGIARAVLSGVVLTVAVETVQYWAPARHSSFGDLLFNTLGTAAGAFVPLAVARLRRLSRRGSLATACAAGAAAVTVLALASQLLEPVVSDVAWWGQWTPRLGRFEAYGGRLVSASVAGHGVPSHRLGDPEPVRAAVRSGAAVELYLHAGPAPRGVAPIFAIGDADERQVLMVAARGDHLLYRRYTRAHRLKLSAPDFRFGGALADVEDGEALRVVIAAHPGRAEAVAVVNGRERRARLHFFDTWGLLLWPDRVADSAGLRALAGAGWIATLFSPAFLLALAAYRPARPDATVPGSPMRRSRSTGGVSAVLGVLLVGLVGCGNGGDASESRRGEHLVAVLGDSDSHGYRDDVQGVIRGGEYHDITYQWTEVLDVARGAQLDQGGRSKRGSRGVIARARAALGLEAKTPRKTDFRWNYARSGAGCASLVREWPRQTRWLVSALRADPDSWSDGLVVIRIGVNDLGQEQHLARYARSGLGAEERAAVSSCVDDIASAVSMIREASPDVRILLVGIADDSSWPYGAVPRRDDDEVARMRAVLDHFDERLRSLATRTPGAAFMGDRAWYRERWAGRDENGEAQLSGYSFGGPTPVTNTRGDAPHHLALADGHAGTIANGLFARALIESVNREFGWRIPPLTELEIARLADPDSRYGIAPDTIATTSTASATETDGR